MRGSYKPSKGTNLTVVEGLLIYYTYFLLPIYDPCTTLVLPPSRNSDPGSHRGPFSPLPTTVQPSILPREEPSIFLPSSTRVECYLPTLLGALSSWSLFCIFVNKVKISPRCELNSRTKASIIILYQVLHTKCQNPNENTIDSMKILYFK